jgi:hypothetical protein
MHLTDTVRPKEHQLLALGLAQAGYSAVLLICSSSCVCTVLKVCTFEILRLTPTVGSFEPASIVFREGEQKKNYEVRPPSHSGPSG